jgi:hypothetical protein
VWLASAGLAAAEKTNHCLCHAIGCALQIDSNVPVAGRLPWFGGLGGLALGLLLRDEVAAQERHEQLRERGRLFFLGAALFFGGLALELDGELQERDIALAELVGKGLGDCFHAAGDGPEQGLREVAARPDGGDLLAGAVFIVGAQRVAGLVLGWVERARGWRKFVFTLGMDRVVDHARSFKKSKKRNAGGAPLLGKTTL